MKKLLTICLWALAIECYAFTASVTINNLCTNTVSGVVVQGDIANDEVTSWSDKFTVTSPGQVSGKMAGSSSVTVQWNTYGTSPYTLRVRYYTNATQTGAAQYVPIGVVSTNSPNITGYLSVCAENPCAWYYSFCVKNTSTMSQSLAVFQFGQPLCWPQPLGSAYMTLGPGESGCLKGGPLCETNGLTIRWNPNGVDCLNNMDGCISVCSNGWSDVPGASPNWGLGAPPSDTGGDNYNPGAGTETDSGSLSNVVWSGSATNLENLIKEGTSVVKDAIDQNTLNDTKNADRLKGSIDGFGSTLGAGLGNLSNAIANISAGGGSNYLSLDMGWTNTLNAIESNQRTNLLPGFGWTTPTNYTQARDLVLANTHAAGGITTMDNAAASASGGYHPVGGGSASTISIPLGQFSMTVDPMSGLWSPVWAFANAFMTWILAAAYLYMVVKDAYQLVADMGKIRPIQVPNFQVHGYNLGVLFAGGFLVAALAAYAACLGIWSLAGWNAGVNIGAAYFQDPFSTVGGSVAIGFNWFKTAFPLDLCLALVTAAIVWKLTMAKALWVATMVLKALVGA